MKLTSEQIKGRIKHLANTTNSDARLLIRIYMMDRFLERLACSKYKDNFIIKGGILVTSMVGVMARSTMDIDACIKNLNLSEENALQITNEIAKISLDDDIAFEVIKASNIMDNFEYPGIRIEMNAIIDKVITPIKLDISTGDIITPREIEYSYHLIIEDKNINLWAYNLETVLAEKLQTILVRDILNTRMRDFYDIYILMNIYKDTIDNQILKDAFDATCKKRNSSFENIDSQIQIISKAPSLQHLWFQYQKKFLYAAEINFDDVINNLKTLVNRLDIGR